MQAGSAAHVPVLTKRVRGSSLTTTQGGGGGGGNANQRQDG